MEEVCSPSGVNQDSAGVEAVYADAPLDMSAFLLRPTPEDAETGLRLQTTNRYRAYQPIPCSIACRNCGEYLGYVLTDERGNIVARPDEGGREFKLIYWSPTRGFVLQLVDAALWAAAASIIPEVLTERLPKYQYERAKAMSTALSVPVDRVPELFDGSSRPQFRSMQHGVCLREGLHPRKPDSTLSAEDHVLLGSANSRFISVTSSLSIGIMWALPLGPLVTINEHVAHLTGGRTISQEELVSVFKDPVAINRTRRCAEDLIDGSVHEWAVEPISSVATALHGPRARVDGVGMPACFPSNREDFARLVRTIPQPGELKADMNATLLCDPVTGSQFVLMRTSRNSIPPHIAGDTETAFPGVMELARQQLKRTCDEYYAGGGMGHLAYFEVDLDVFQYERRVTTADQLVVPRLPFLLLLHDPASFADDVHKIYLLKKGEDDLARTCAPKL